MKTLCINFMSMSSPTDFIRTTNVFKIMHTLISSPAEDTFSGKLFLEHFSPYIKVLPQM